MWIVKELKLKIDDIDIDELISIARGRDNQNMLKYLTSLR